MAFNDTKNEPIINSGFITSSRGLNSNDAFGQLFKGVGQTMDNVLQAQDKTIRTKIDMEANDIVDQEATAATPPAVQEHVAKINSLKEAKAQGMSEAEFQTRMLQRVKDARSSIPKGYWSVLDSAISSAQGTSTADQLRRARLAESEQLSRATEGKMDAETKAFNAYYDGNEAAIMSKQGLDLYERLFKKPFGLETSNLRELQVIVGAVKGSEADITKEQARAAIDEKNAKKAASTLIWSNTNKLMSEANPLFKSFQEKFKAAGADNNISDEERAQLLPVWQTFKADITRQSALALANVDDPNVISLGKAERADVMSGLQERLSAFEEVFNSPTPASLKLLQDEISLRSSISDNKLLKVPYVQMYQAAIKLGWKKEELDDLLKEVPSQSGNKNAKEDLDKGLTDAITLGVITGQTSLGEGLKDMGEDASKESKAALIDKHMKILASPTATPEQVSQVASGVFNEGLDDVLEKYAAKGNRVNLFEKFVNPSISEKILASNGAEAYTNWANKQMRIVGAEAGDLLIDAQKFSEIAQVTFDGKQFLVNPIKGTGLTTAHPVGQAWEQYKLNEATKAVYNMNKYLRLMDPIWQKEFGKDYDAGNIMLQVMGQDINKVAKEGSLLNHLLGTVGNYLSGPDGPVGKDTMDKAKENLPPDMPTQGDQSSMKGKSLIDFARADSEESVKITEAYGPGRPGRPSATIRDLAQSAAADTGMSNITFTSGKGNTISTSGKKRGQKTTMHSTGLALDVAGFASEEEKFAYIENAVAHGAKGIGVYRNGSVHIDTGKERHWDWSGAQEDELKAAIERGKLKRKQLQASNS